MADRNHSWLYGVVVGNSSLEVAVVDILRYCLEAFRSGKAGIIFSISISKRESRATKYSSQPDFRERVYPYFARRIQIVTTEQVSLIVSGRPPSIIPSCAIVSIVPVAAATVITWRRLARFRRSLIWLESSRCPVFGRVIHLRLLTLLRVLFHVDTFSASWQADFLPYFACSVGCSIIGFVVILVDQAVKSFQSKFLP
jgi:hypothetical protein